MTSPGPSLSTIVSYAVQELKFKPLQIPPNEDQRTTEAITLTLLMVNHGDAFRGFFNEENTQYIVSRLQILRLDLLDCAHDPQTAKDAHLVYLRIITQAAISCQDQCLSSPHFKALLDATAPFLAEVLFAFDQTPRSRYYTDLKSTTPSIIADLLKKLSILGAIPNIER